MDWSSYPEGKYLFSKPNLSPTQFERYIANKFKQVPAKILEIGPGPGKFIKLVLRTKGKHVVAVDPSRKGYENLLNLKYVREANRKGRFVFYQETWPIENDFRFDLNHGRKYNLVFSQSSLQYLEHWERAKAFRQIYECLDANNGLFALAVQSLCNVLFIKNSRPEVVQPALVSRLGHRVTCRDGFPRTFFSKNQLQRELVKAGFKPEAICIGIQVVNQYSLLEIPTVLLIALAYKNL